VTPQQAAATSLVLDEVLGERRRQDDKWGEQNHRNGTGPDVALLNYPEQLTYQQLADQMRAFVNLLAEHRMSLYAPILLEEVFEALAEDDDERLRRELVQVAAVAVQWVEAIDRRRS
jgi:hypothetical protein